MAYHNIIFIICKESAKNSLTFYFFISILKLYSFRNIAFRDISKILKGEVMEFLKKMKSREIIEMSLKTIFMVIVGLILIFLMEGMIYSIYMNKINENQSTQYVPAQCVAYCEEIGEDEFKIYLHNKEAGSWSTKIYNESKDQIENAGYSDIVWRTPNAFEVSINGVHYVVMAVFIVAIIGFYGWRFYKLDKEYKSFAKKYNKTGKIFA
jgi:hypothetical protein